MLRRFVITAALAACTLVPVSAQEQATVVLTSGQRYNGILTYPRADTNINDDRMSLAANGDQSFPIGEVSVIDLAGGTPSPAEANALPPTGGVMIMRDGSAVRGHLHNIRRGGVVQWVDERGERRDYDAALVSRLYLNAENARSTYLRNASPAVGTSGSGAISAVTLNVEATQQWVDTGIDVRRGDRLQLDAAGTIQYAPGLSTAPGGRAGAASASYPVPGAGAGALIARVGGSAPFAVGAGARDLTMPEDGRLFLGVNDDNVADNRGAFIVSIRRR
jgi:hypothetical protein